MGQCRLVVILAFGACASPALAQSISVPTTAIRPVRFEQAPVIDGRIDDAVWTKAQRLDGFRQVQPGDNLEPSQHTEVLIGYDRRALYLAFRADDTSGRVRATLARRDAIADDDIIGVYLDTFHDQRRAYYLFFNPYGIQADGIFTEGTPEPDLTVDLVIESKGTVDANGYSVEAAIPFASLRYRSGESPMWGLHVQRFIRRDRNEQISWTRASSIKPGNSVNSPRLARVALSKSSEQPPPRRPARRRRRASSREKWIRHPGSPSTSGSRRR
jgi:hypothetical protein